MNVLNLKKLPYPKEMIDDFSEMLLKSTNKLIFNFMSPEFIHFENKSVVACNYFESVLKLDRRNMANMLFSSDGKLLPDIIYLVYNLLCAHYTKIVWDFDYSPNILPKDDFIKFTDDLIKDVQSGKIKGTTNLYYVDKKTYKQINKKTKGKREKINKETPSNNIDGPTRK